MPFPRTRILDSVIVGLYGIIKTFADIIYFFLRVYHIEFAVLSLKKRNKKVPKLQFQYWNKLLMKRAVPTNFLICDRHKRPSIWSVSLGFSGYIFLFSGVTAVFSTDRGCKLYPGAICNVEVCSFQTVDGYPDKKSNIFKKFAIFSFSAFSLYTGYFA